MNTNIIKSILVAVTYGLLSPTHPGMAQSSKLDSMIRALSDMEEDTHKIYKLIDIGVIYLHQSAYSFANSYFEQSLVISEKLNHEKGRALYYGNSGLADYYLGQYDDALSKFDISLKIFKAIHDRKGIANTYSNIGMLYSTQGKFTEAIENYNAALSYRDESDQRGKSAAYNNLGIVYYQLGDYPKALEYYLLSVKIDEELGDKMDLAFSYNNLAMVYEYLQKYDEAIRYFMLANALCREVGHVECVSGTNMNLASLYKKQGKVDAAIEKFNECLIRFEEIGNQHEIASASNNLGNLYLLIGQYEMALQYLLAALKIYEELDNEPGTMKTLSNLGVVYREQHQYEDALYAFETSTQLAKTSESKMSLRDTYFEWSVLDSMMGNTGKALVHYKLHTLYKDSLQAEQNLELLAEIQNKYDFEKKESEIKKLENEQQINALELKVQRETVARVGTEKEKLHAENLNHLQRIELLDKDKKLQELALQKNEADMSAHRTEALHKEDLLKLMIQQNEIKDLRLKRQSQFQMYMFTGFLLLSLLAIFAYSHFRTLQKLKLQLLRNKIASDLHDDVGSTLSSISIFSQMARQQSKDVVPLLDSIGESSRKMLDAMADIVWTINPENDQFEKIILRMRSFAYELLGAKNIEFEFTAEEDISMLKLPMDVRKNLYLIFKEATNNLVKYAEANKATFAIKEEKKVLSLLIRDNGKGFDVTRSSEGNGIKNMKKRAEEIGGRLSIDSIPGNGTTIQLSVAV